MNMRLFNVSIICFAGLISCKTDPKELTSNYIRAINQYDTTQINKILDKNFHFVNSPFGYGRRTNIDSFKTVRGSIQLLNSSIKDHIVQTTERWTSVYDSLLSIKVKLVVHNTYNLDKNHIESITINKIENFVQYNEQIKTKLKAFDSYVDFEHGNLNKQEKKDQLINLLTEFSHIPPTAQKEYITRAYLKDSEFISNNNMFKMGLKFVGNRTVLVSVLGFSIGTNYAIDGDVIQVEPTQGSLPMPLFIKNANTMIGKSVSGDYIFKRVH